VELPPSGWYPDPYGVPGLLRWWDGSAWTQHTYQAGGTNAPASAEPASTAQGAQSTTVQPAVQAGAQPTTVQPAVQPTAVQPAAVQPTTVQPGGQAGQQGPDANRTQVLFLGDDTWSAPGESQAQGDRFGYYRAQRRRRMWLMGGLAGGTAAALGVIALVVSSLGNSTPAPSASHTTRPVAATKPPPTPSRTPSPTPSATSSGSLIDDGTSGLSYTSLPSPWVPNCPSGLNTQGFSWTEGQSAVAGHINGGQTTWYGVACSAPLPGQYGYNGPADLQNVATNVVNTLANSYYSPLQHGFQQEVSQPVNLSGHAGWEIKFLMTYTNAQGQGLGWTSEEGAVVVADNGSAIPPAVFFASIPGNLGEGNVDTLVSSLRLRTPAVPGGGGSPGDGSPAAGSPGDGGGNGGGNGNGGDGGNGHGNGHGN
jgi:hypothetical protein